MEEMINQQFFALDMEIRIERLQLEEKLVTLLSLLNELWNQVFDKTTPRRVVEFTFEHEGMEFTVGELKVPIFYLLNEKTFWYQLNCLLKSKIQSKLWMKATLQQTFIEDWKSYPFMPRCFKKIC